MKTSSPESPFGVCPSASTGSVSSTFSSGLRPGLNFSAEISGISSAKGEMIAGVFLRDAKRVKSALSIIEPTAFVLSGEKSREERKEGEESRIVALSVCSLIRAECRELYCVIRV